MSGAHRCTHTWQICWEVCLHSYIRSVVLGALILSIYNPKAAVPLRNKDPEHSDAFWHLPVKLNACKTFQPCFPLAFSHFMAQQELSKLFWLHFHMTLISKGRAINTMAISILVIVSEIVIISRAPESLLASYLFIGHMEWERGCSPRWMWWIEPRDAN